MTRLGEWGGRKVGHASTHGGSRGVEITRVWAHG